MREIDLYEPMKKWLHQYLCDKYKEDEVITIDSHARRLDRVLRDHEIVCDVAIDIDIQVDVLGIVKNEKDFKLFFVEAKVTSLTLHDLGQLWIYCKLINPEEAFLLTSADLGSLNKILRVFNREDLLDFGESKRIKKMKVAIWNKKTKSPDISSMIPKI